VLHARSRFSSPGLVVVPVFLIVVAVAEIVGAMLLIQGLIIGGHVADAGLDRVLADREFFADAEVSPIDKGALTKGLSRTIAVAR
jgi:hypothetical protein